MCEGEEKEKEKDEQRLSHQWLNTRRLQIDIDIDRSKYACAYRLYSCLLTYLRHTHGRGQRWSRSFCLLWRWRSLQDRLWMGLMVCI